MRSVLLRPRAWPLAAKVTALVLLLALLGFAGFLVAFARAFAHVC